MILKVFYTISDFRSRKISSGQLDFSFEHPPKNACSIPKRFWSAIIEKFGVFFEKFLKAIWRRRILASTNLVKKFCQKLSFSARSAKLTIKSAVFWKKNSKSQRTHNMKCCLDNHAENCSPELWKVFGRSEKKPIELQSMILYLPQNVKMSRWNCWKWFC